MTDSDVLVGVVVVVVIAVLFVVVVVEFGVGMAAVLASSNFADLLIIASHRLFCFSLPLLLVAAVVCLVLPFLLTGVHCVPCSFCSCDLWYLFLAW